MRRVKKALLTRIHALRQLPFLGLLLLVACEEGLTPVSFEGISGKVTYNGEVPDATEWVFSGLVTAISPETPVEEKMEASVTIKLSGKPGFIA